MGTGEDATATIADDGWRGAVAAVVGGRAVAPPGVEAPQLQTAAPTRTSVGRT